MEDVGETKDPLLYIRGIRAGLDWTGLDKIATPEPYPIRPPGLLLCYHPIINIYFIG
jgi:hypothetical protein